MNKNLRLAMCQVFEKSVQKRWPNFEKSKKPLMPKSPHEFFLFDNSYVETTLSFSICPNPKNYWSSFYMCFAWFPKDDTDFTECKRENIRIRPPTYNLKIALDSASNPNKGEFCLNELSDVGRCEENNWAYHKFSSFDDSNLGFGLPLLSPIHTFDPKTQGPEDYKRLSEIEKNFTIEDGIPLATPVIEEVIELFEITFWPLVSPRFK